jgi:hypothetical protein
VTLIATTVADHALAAEEAPSDLELARLYRDLRRHPDRPHPSPVFAAARAAVRLAMSLEDVSREELETMLSWLARIAKRSSTGPSSRNHLEEAYAAMIREPTVEEFVA